MTLQQSCGAVSVERGGGAGEMNEYSFVGHVPLIHGCMPLHMLLITSLLEMDECAPLTWSGRLQPSKQSFTATGITG